METATPTREGADEAVARAVGWVMLVAGAVAVVAAGALMTERVLVLEDPTHVPACTVDAVLSCTSVMTSEQAEAFGIPNPIIGLAGFGAVAALGAAVVTGAQLARALWLAIQAGMTFALLFVHWLFVQSVFRIDALCPYCMVVWVCTIAIFVYATLHNLALAGGEIRGHLRAPIAVATRYHSTILVVWIVALAAIIGVEFWDYWQERF